MPCGHGCTRTPVLPASYALAVPSDLSGVVGEHSPSTQSSADCIQVLHLEADLDIVAPPCCEGSSLRPVVQGLAGAVRDGQRAGSRGTGMPQLRAATTAQPPHKAHPRMAVSPPASAPSLKRLALSEPAGHDEAARFYEGLRSGRMVLKPVRGLGLGCRTPPLQLYANDMAPMAPGLPNLPGGSPPQQFETDHNMEAPPVALAAPEQEAPVACFARQCQRCW